MKKLILLLLFVFMINSVYAGSIENLGYFKEGQSIDLPQTCANCTFNNITILRSPTSIILQDEIMTKKGISYNYTLNSTQTKQNGKYIVEGIGDPDGILTTWIYSFEINPSGSRDLDYGAGLSLFGGLIILIIVSIGLFIMGKNSENTSLKIIFIGLATIVIFISILFSTVTIQQTLWNYVSIIEGFSTFLFVFKILIGVAITSLLVFSVIFAYKSWMKRRGFID